MGPANENLHRAAVPLPLRVEFEGGEGMPLRAIVSGEIDYASSFSMQVRIAAACRRRRARGLIVDLAGAEFMSSSGLGAILSLQRERACLQGGLIISRPSREVLDILERTGLDRRLMVVDTVEEAEVLLLYSAAGADVSRHPHRDTSFN
ncbi:MAG: STAS domain-containing protein [Solirubrobacteraceae bacterium]